MDLLQGYCDESEENNIKTEATDLDLVPKITINPNPNVHIEKATKQIDHTTSIVFYNPKYSELATAELGPTKPFAPKKSETGKNLKTGNIETHHMNDFSFETRLNLIQKHFYSEKTDRKRVREKVNRDDPLEYQGPWAEYKVEGKDEVVRPVMTEEEAEKLREETSTIKKLKQQEQVEKELEKDMVEETTIFHGEEFKDYLGRTYINPPSELKPKDHDCYAPKKQIYTWSHHTAAVNQVKFFPKYGHLLLSCSMDKTVKIYNVQGKNLLRTYMGHKGGVRDINFNADGKKFLSTAYDKVIQLWDTETGQIISTLGNNELHYTAKFYPLGENEFLTACRDKKIYQFDIREKKTVQEYNTHLQAVNSITYIEDGKRFVSTSDDKTIKIWEYGLPVEIKYVSDPTMHSMPATTISADGKWFAGQSLDNQIIVYYARERFRINRKKIFKGHMVAGYACQPSFSPDNKYLISGESNGNLVVWDWKTTHIVRKLKAHEGVCISVDWHPVDTSKVVTCGWDGKIVMFD